jgi:anti-anti-sigma factor
MNTKFNQCYIVNSFDEGTKDFKATYQMDIVIYTITKNRATIKEARELKNMLDTEILMKRKKIIVDLSGCEYIDSTFIGVLVYTLKIVSSIGGDLKLVNLRTEQNALFHWNRLIRIFDNFSSVQEAILSFQSNFSLK